MFRKTSVNQVTYGDELVTGFLDKGTNFEGKLAFEGTLRIKGNFEGEIFTNDTLIIESGAVVKAQIEAGHVIVDGELEGVVHATESVIMHPPAKFKGSVTSPCLKIEEGVLFEGASFIPEA